jgi:O-antigen ligase
VAVLLAMLKFPFRASLIGWTILLATALSVLIGALQITGGMDSPWYFYDITNYGVTVGFFANANHMATLLVVTVPFLAALSAAARGRRREAHRSSGLFVILAGLFALVLVGLAINGSLAGLGLMVPVSAASAMLLMRRRGVPAWAIALVALLTLTSVGAVFSGRFDNNLIAAEAQSSEVSRYTTFGVSLEAARTHFPFGSGIGTFQPIYRLFEDPERVTNTYVNHVHSDWIEIVLETGIFGLGLLLAFLAWWTSRAIAIWRASEPDPFSRAATIASAAIMAHSLVDYPLRTAAIAAVFAACCAIMAARRAAPARTAKAWPSKRPARHLSAD